MYLRKLLLFIQKEKHSPIRPISKCLDLSRSIESYVIDDKTIIAASGPNYFRINLSAPCSHLGVGNLQLRTGNDSQRRMCGEIGDKVITRDGLHCQVQSLDILTRDQFKSMERAKRAK